MGTPQTIYSIATKIGGPGLGTVSYNAVKALYEEGRLQTAVSYGNKGRDIPGSKFRVIPGNPAKLLFFLPEHYYRPMRKGFLDYITSKIILRRGCDVFHGWNNQALRSIKAAEKTGAKTILECGSTHREFRDNILEEEYRRFGVEIGKTPRYARESSLEEVRLADYILLPSEFARRTFLEAGVSGEKIFIINRGVDLDKFGPAKGDKSRFKILFAGRLSLRKGVQYLLQAWKELNIRNCELVLAGSLDEDAKDVLSGYRDTPNITVKGFLKDLAGLYRESSVFVFPSIEEGSAKVTYEAMASGLPVITTENSGSVVRHGIDGFIIPVRDVRALKERISFFIENPEEVKIMGMNAIENARRFTWQNYRSRLIEIYESMV